MAKLRTHNRRRLRKRIDLNSTILAGNSRHQNIVYGYGFPSHPGRIKIGFSSRGLARVIEQSTSFPEKPVVLFVIHHPRAKDLETAFHRAFAHSQSDTLGVEWFDITLEDVIAVSPDLRRALQRGRALGRVRVITSVLFGLIGLMIVPWLYPQIDALLTAGISFGSGRRTASTYAGALAEWQVDDALACARETLRRAITSGAPVTSVLALLPTAILAALPWMLRRSQVRA